MKELPPSKRDRFDRDNRGDRGDRGGRRDRFDREAPTRFDRSGKEMAVYRLAVGKRQHVRPGAIVGALANEGGLSSKDFGRINIAVDHTLVELPKDLPKEVFEALEDTRISGQLINIEPDPGAPMGRPAAHRSRGDRDDRGGRGGFRGGRDDRGGRGGFRGRDDRRDDRGGRGGFRGRDDRRDDRGGRGGFRSRNNDRY